MTTWDRVVNDPTSHMDCMGQSNTIKYKKYNLCHSWVENVTGVSFTGKGRGYLFTISILVEISWGFCPFGRVHLEWAGKCTETKFHVAGKWKGPYNSVGGQISQLVPVEVCRIRTSLCSAAVWRTGYPLTSPLSLSFPLPHITVSHAILHS